MQDEEANRKRFNRRVKCFSIMSILLGLITLGGLVAFIVFISKNVRVFTDDPVEYNSPQPSYKSWGFDGDNTQYNNWPSNDGNVKHMQQGPMKTVMMVETTTSSYDDYENEYGSDTTSTYDDYSNDYDSQDYDGDDYSHDSSKESDSQYYDKDRVNYYDDRESVEKAHETVDNSNYYYTETNETDSQENRSSNEEPNYQYNNYPVYEYTETNESQDQDKETDEKESYYQYNDYPYYDYTETNETYGQDSVTSNEEPNYQYKDYPEDDYIETDETEDQGKVANDNEKPSYQYYDYPKYDNTEPYEPNGQGKLTGNEEPNYQYYDYPTYDYTDTNETDGQDNAYSNGEPNYQYYDYPKYDYTETSNEQPNYQYYDYPKYDYTETNETDGQDNAYSNGEPNYQYYDYPKYDYTETNETDSKDNAYSNGEPNYQYYEYSDYHPTEGNETDSQDNTTSNKELVNADKSYNFDENYGTNKPGQEDAYYYEDGNPVSEPENLNLPAVKYPGYSEDGPVGAPETAGNPHMDKFSTEYDNGEEKEKPVAALETDVHNNVTRGQDPTYPHHGGSKPIQKENTFDYTVDRGEMELDIKDDIENIDNNSKAYFQYKTDDEDKKRQHINWLDTVTTRILADVTTTPLQQKKENNPTHQPLWKKLGYKK